MELPLKADENGVALLKLQCENHILKPLHENYGIDRVCPKFCVNTAGQCKTEQKFFKAGAAPAAAALSTK